MPGAFLVSSELSQRKARCVAGLGIDPQAAEMVLSVVTAAVSLLVYRIYRRERETVAGAFRPRGRARFCGDA